MKCNFVILLFVFTAFISVSCDSGLKFENPIDPDNQASQKEKGELGGQCYSDKTCNPGLICNETHNLCVKEDSSGNDDDYTDSDHPDSDTTPYQDSDTTPSQDSDAIPYQDSDTTQDPDSDNEPGSCATDNLDTECQTDNDCGACMICITGGKCAKGCTSDSDCTLTGTFCNKKLARCLSIFASSRACDEINCSSGCCYAEKGLSGLKCASGPNAAPAICGLCPQNQIYSPEDSKCVNAVCSMTTDDCPVLNSNSLNPPAKCYACKPGEYICKAKTTSSGCSSGTIINMKECIPSGRQCIEGVTNCCSGSPCIQGFCY
ncbi:hypothetical protein J6W78_00860 [bacterium]|nr:hypothetical protein [bacterium]